MLLRLLKKADYNVKLSMHSKSYSLDGCKRTLNLYSKHQHLVIL